MEDVFIRLARHLENLIMGYPYSPALPDLLREMFSAEEAETALGIPNDPAPFETVDAQTIARQSGQPLETAVRTLTSMAERNVIYSARNSSGQTGYALLQVVVTACLRLFSGTAARMIPPGAWPTRCANISPCP